MTTGSSRHLRIQLRAPRRRRAAAESLFRLLCRFETYRVVWGLAVKTGARERQTAPGPSCESSRASNKRYSCGFTASARTERHCGTSRAVDDDRPRLQLRRPAVVSAAAMNRMGAKSASYRMVAITAASVNRKQAGNTAEHGHRHSQRPLRSPCSNFRTGMRKPSASSNGEIHRIPMTGSNTM